MHIARLVSLKSERQGFLTFAWKTVASGSFNYKNIVSAWTSVEAEL